MSPLEEALHRLRAELTRLEIPWALIGGLAVSLRSEPRTTRDIDVVLALESAKDEDRLVRDLIGFGYQRIEEGTLWQRRMDHLATLRLRSPILDQGVGILVDLMFASSGIEPEIVGSAEPLAVLPGFSVPVARTGHLIALKVLADRAQDRADLQMLLRVATDRDLMEAREALALITRRGFDREHDLFADFERQLRNDR